MWAVTGSLCIGGRSSVTPRTRTVGGAAPLVNVTSWRALGAIQVEKAWAGAVAGVEQSAPAASRADQTLH